MNLTSLNDSCSPPRSHSISREFLFDLSVALFPSPQLSVFVPGPFRSAREICRASNKFYRTRIQVNRVIRLPAANIGVASSSRLFHLRSVPSVLACQTPASDAMARTRNLRRLAAICLFSAIFCRMKISQAGFSSVTAVYGPP